MAIGGPGGGFFVNDSGKHFVVECHNGGCKASSEKASLFMREVVSSPVTAELHEADLMNTGVIPS